MRLDEYAACDATALAELIRRGDVRAEEAHAAAVEAINQVNGALNAVADGPWEAPLEYVRDGPFGGVPFVLKDLGAHPKGIPARWGTRLSGEGIAFPYESFVIRRFREAGLAIGGLTTTPEFGLSANSEALVYGSTRNPWDATRSAGGSSGGSGALVAAGAVPAGHANDGGGSIRIPAAFNGLVGLKPSRGRISDGPDRQELAWGLATEGVLTRSVRDCAGLLDVAAGAMPGDKFVIRDPVRPWSQEVGADGERLRVAIHTASWAGTPVDPEVAAAVEAVGRTLNELGHVVEWATPIFAWDALIAIMLSIYAASCAESVAFVSAVTGSRPSAETLECTTLVTYEYGRDLTVLEMATLRATANELTRTVGDFFTHWDLLITPTVNVPPLPLGYLDANDPALDAEGWMRRRYDVCSFTQLFNISGTPAISLPLGWTSEGMPIGVQLAAPMCEEATLIRVGSKLEEAMPWRMRRPSIHAASTNVGERT
jgi:amidase